ncbi:hypothetical protein NL50_16445 [Clostridium acetobutylicum]|nr:hypothetical protein NL50_16445 [Clostridium acetobutylicum]
MHNGKLIKSILISLFVIFIVGCGKASEGNKQDNKDSGKAEIAVIESSTFNNNSYIKLYTLKGEEVQDIKINCVDVNSGFLSPVKYNDKVYTNSIGGYSNRSKKVVEFNVKNNKYNTYDIAEGIFSVDVDDSYIYTTNSPPKGSIITKYNIKKRSIEKTLNLPGLIEHIALYGNYIYSFADADERDGTIIISEINKYTLNLEKSMRVKSDQSVFDSTIYGDNIYFSHMMSQDGNKPSNTISRLNIKDNTVSDIKLGADYPDHLKVYNGNLYISHYNPVENSGNKLTEMNLATGEQKLHPFQHNLMQIEVQDNKLYTCDDKNMYIYNLGEFKEKSRFKIMDNRKDYRIDGFFLMK